MLHSKKERLISVSPYNKTQRPRFLNRNRPLTSSTVSSSTSTSTAPDESTKLKVFVRVRPFNHKEVTCNCKKVVNVVDEKTLVFDPKEVCEPFFLHGQVQKGRDINKRLNKDMLFEFNRVFDEDTPNDVVFEATTKEIVKSIFDGYNCSVFAYGATGAGKTFTMLGTQEQPGITYLTIVELLKNVETSSQNEMKVSLGASYIEVYNERVRDLLHPNVGELQLREDGGRVAISGLLIETIRSSNHLFSLLETGNQNRSQHPTDSNSESSRSHAIFQVHVRMEQRGTLKIAKLSMIDLAGSERGAATGCKGIRFKEGSNINKSLLALGNCINSLAEGLKHIPYRDSKLTRILKDSLGGNCQTMMIANVSPSSSAFEDTYNTLKYATRAKSIKSKITKNYLNETHSIAYYKKLVEELKTKLEQGAIIPDLSNWKTRIESVMGERKKIHKEILSLLSQQRLTEWRLKPKERALSLYESVLDPHSLKRAVSSVNQLKARSESIKNRLDEYKPAQEANEQMYKALVEDISKNEKLTTFLKPTIDLYNQEISAEDQRLCLAYKEKIVNLQAKQEEKHTFAINTVLPVLNEFYSLLRGLGHVTNDLTYKYQEALRSLEGVKAVTWGEDDEDSTPNSSQNYTLRLSLSRLKVESLTNGAGGEPHNPPVRSLPLKENNRLIRPQINGPMTMKPIQSLVKTKTFIKPKVTTMNKENIRYPVVGTPKTKPTSTPSSGFKSKIRPMKMNNISLNPRSYVKMKPGRRSSLRNGVSPN